MGRTAQVQRDARIGEAEARKDAIIKQAIAEEERMAAKYKNDSEIARAKRDSELKKAAYDKEVEAEVSIQLYSNYYLLMIIFGLITSVQKQKWPMNSRWPLLSNGSGRKKCRWK